ncbi:MAG TPA: hypothetical protein VLG15_05050 [Thermoanaerobaculia bacterium]|nr:hypothetical protein [Thermoanaerobaculia bacterium]
MLEQLDKRQRVRRISETIGEVLESHAFGLLIPTDTLSDALATRGTTNDRIRHLFDCDTGSFIYLTVAENLGLRASLVDITLPSGSGHNYVRWEIGDETMDWDVNGRYECTTPSSTTTWEGKTMTGAQTKGYSRALRAELFKRRRLYDRALVDYREAMRLYPESPLPQNNFAWLVATRFPGHSRLRREALSAATRAVEIRPDATFLDTLACVWAALGDFERATRYSDRAIAKEPGNSDYLQRREGFRSIPPRSCAGAD